MFLSSTLVILVVALGAFHTAQGHAVGRLQVFGTNIVAEVQGRDPASSLGSPKAWERSFHIELDERQSANSTCGTQAGGTSCAPDYCCSAEVSRFLSMPQRYDIDNSVGHMWPGSFVL